MQAASTGPQPHLSKAAIRLPLPGRAPPESSRTRSKAVTDRTRTRPGWAQNHINGVLGPATRTLSNNADRRSPESGPFVTCVNAIRVTAGERRRTGTN